MQTPLFQLLFFALYVCGLRLYAVSLSAVIT